MRKVEKNETARDRFKRLATLRTNEVLRRLKILRNCANRQAYEYSEKDIEAIFSAIERKVREVKTKFHFPKEERFKL
ncbi:MAG: hypothetical protein HQ555_04395 [Candidatus Aminicenantes bacterium]|nr:hypothetical protein [Candidatus Aminicenantes bacterium]